MTGIQQKKQNKTLLLPLGKTCPKKLTNTITSCPDNSQYSESFIPFANELLHLDSNWTKWRGFFLHGINLSGYSWL